MLSIRPYPGIRSPFFLGGVKPQLEGDQLLKSYEKHSLWFEGTYEFVL
jgi:hypothetical protein